jgi:hypothetical protein
MNGRGSTGTNMTPRLSGGISLNVKGILSKAMGDYGGKR